MSLTSSKAAENETQHSLRLVIYGLSMKFVMPTRSHCLIVMVAFGVASWPVWPQVRQDNRNVVVNGKSGNMIVVHVDGRTYVDVQTLTRIAHGSVMFQGNQILLNLPAAQGEGAPESGSEQNQTQFSQAFAKAAIEEITLIREWASPLANAIQNGYPVTETWVSGYQQQAESGLRAVSASASTEADRNALQLLTNEFDAVREWSLNLVQARKSMSAANYALSKDALQNDPLSRKIIACAHFLGSMLANGTFQDDASCH